MTHARRTLLFLAIVLTALALVPGGAHLFSLPNKIGLSAEPYFIVQGIYRGWSLFGLVILPALFANALAAIALRDERVPGLLAAAAAALVAINLAIFFAWTYPANVATGNWTSVPDNWRQLRDSWEYSHAVNAVLMFGALCAIVLAALSARPVR